MSREVEIANQRAENHVYAVFRRSNRSTQLPPSKQDGNGVLSIVHTRRLCEKEKEMEMKRRSTRENKTEEDRIEMRFRISPK